ncbi:MAG TPA: carboxyl transferase domain-containing protein [Candidatus Dormibacteraeota bacterium]|nr:carboxyl transferase domain-containing protein [Candidatus Dormibacteraeota bacterium]
MTWETELEEMRRREELALAMGGPERVERQHAAGRLTVRERVERLLDAGSFEEYGGLAGFATYRDGLLERFTPANSVVGTGRIDGRRCVVCGDDFTVRGGAADAAIHQKQVYAERLAGELRLPLVRLVDGTGGGGSVKSYETTGRTYVPANPGWDVVVENLGRVPVAAACLGPVAGLGAARVVTAHFSVMVRDTSQLFVAGPPVVLHGMGREVTKDELGGWQIHARESGAVDNLAEDEDGALAQVRRFLSYLPQSVWEAPARRPCQDDPRRTEPALRAIVPRSRRQVYDMRRLVGLVVDRGSLFEMARAYGGSVITALARLDGWPVAVVASDPRVYGGGLTAAASDKLARFVDFADTFHLPVVNFVDQPGFVIGVEAERAGTIRRGARALAAVYQARVPWVSILVRKVFGVAGAAHGNAQSLNLRYAWPSGDWGSLPLEGGVQAAYRRDLEAAEDPAALEAEIMARLDAVRSPFRTAEAFGVEKIIDPADTRRLLCEWAADAHRVAASQVGPPARAPRP